MNETGPGQSALPLLQRALAAALPFGFLLALSGFTRFDVPQTALSAALLVLLTLTFALRPDRAGSEESTSAAFRWTVAVLLAWVIGSALARGITAAAVDETVLFGLLGLATALGARRGLAASLTLGFAVVAAAMAVVGGAQAAGLALIPGIPNVTPDGVRLFSDDPASGATAALVVGAALLALQPAAGPARLAGAAGAVLAAVAAALAWPTAGLAVAALTCIAMAAVAIAGGTRPGAGLRLPGALLLAAALGAGVGGLTAEPAGQPAPFVERPAVSLMEPGPAEPWSLEGALPFYLRASVPYAVENVVFGTGPGTYAAQITEHADADADFARSRPGGLPWVHRGPSPLLQWTATLGIVAPLAVLCLLLLALVPALRARSAEATGALVALACLLVVGPGLYGGATMLAAGILLGAAATADGTEHHRVHAATQWTRTLLAAAALVFAAQTARWSYFQAGANVFLAAGRVADATTWIARAGDTQDRYETHLNRGLLLAMPTVDEPDYSEAIEQLTAAADLSPGHARAQYALGSIAVRTLGRIAEQPAEAQRKRQAAMALLRRATEIEPNNVDAGVLLAQVYMAAGDYPPGVAELERLDARGLPDEAARVVLEALGIYWADVREDPRKALEYFDRAEFLPGDAARGSRLEQRIQECRQWVVTGRRPRHEPGHGPFGEDDGHGHGTVPVPGADPHAGHDDHEEHNDEPGQLAPGPADPAAPPATDPHAGHGDEGSEREATP